MHHVPISSANQRHSQGVIFPVCGRGGVYILDQLHKDVCGTSYTWIRCGDMSVDALGGFCLKDPCASCITYRKSMVETLQANRMRWHHGFPDLDGMCPTIIEAECLLFHAVHMTPLQRISPYSWFHINPIDICNPTYPLVFAYCTHNAT